MAAAPDISHRDRRAQRDVDRMFWSMVGVTLALTGFALFMPLPYAGLCAVVALAVLGFVYMGWSDRLLAGYAGDLRSARDGGPGSGFARVEVSSPVGLYRDEESAPSPSPHSRRGRTHGVLRPDPEPPSDSAEKPGQL